jgi:hypothetical protein
MAEKGIKRAVRRSDSDAAETAATPMSATIPMVGGIGGPVETTGRFVVIFKNNGSSEPLDRFEVCHCPKCRYRP